MRRPSTESLLLVLCCLLALTSTVLGFSRGPRGCGVAPRCRNCIAHAQPSRASQPVMGAAPAASAAQVQEVAMTLSKYSQRRTGWRPHDEFFEQFGLADIDTHTHTHTDRKLLRCSSYSESESESESEESVPRVEPFVERFQQSCEVYRGEAHGEYNALHALGLCTYFYSLMKEYPLEEDQMDDIFNHAMTSVGFDGVAVRNDARLLLSEIQGERAPSEEQFLSLSPVLAAVRAWPRPLRANKFLGVGLGRTMEMLGVSPCEESFRRWSERLQRPNALELLQAWSSFVNEQKELCQARAQRRPAPSLRRFAFRERKTALIALNNELKKYPFLENGNALLSMRTETLSISSIKSFSSQTPH